MPAFEFHDNAEADGLACQSPDAIRNALAVELSMKYDLINNKLVAR
jgi:hypothetical protein